MSTPSTGPGDLDVVGDRIVAQLIDLVVLFLLMAVAFVALAGLFPGLGAAGVEFLAIVLFVVVGLGYGTVLEGRYGGTVGKAATDLHVVGRGGREISYGQAFVRNVPALFGGWPTWLIGIAAIAIDERNRRLFDRAASTYVVADPIGPELTAERREAFTR